MGRFGSAKSPLIRSDSCVTKQLGSDDPNIGHWLFTEDFSGGLHASLPNCWPRSHSIALTSYPAPPTTGHLHRPICERLRAPCCHWLVADQHYPPIGEIKSQSATFLHMELQLNSVITKRIYNPYTRAHLMISSCTHANLAYLTLTIFFFSFFRKPLSPALTIKLMF